MHALIRRPKGRGGSKPSGILPPNFNRGWHRIICAASGPSIGGHQVALLRDRARLNALGWHVIVVNTTWQLLPNADVLYAGDTSWWDLHLPAVQKNFAGECWTQSRRIAHRDHLHHVKCSDEPGLTTKPGVVFSGSNSGYQAVNLAYLFGASEILLVGYDMQRTYGISHWHGDHPSPLNPDMPIESWVKKFGQLAHDLIAKEVAIVNCSIETALTCFPRQDLESCLS